MEAIGTSGEHEVIFEMDLLLEEDIVSELEGFILLGRLGIVDEALHVLDNVLWKHLRLFPITAEAAAFLLEHELWSRLQDLVKELHNQNIEFEQHDEAEFMKTLHILSSIVPNNCLLSSFGLEDTDLVRELHAAIYESPPQIQKLEILAYVATRDYVTRDERLALFFSRHISALIGHDLLWEATRMFTIACLLAQGEDEAGPMQSCHLWYNDLVSAVYEKYQAINPSTDTDSHNVALVCELEAKTVLMQLLVEPHFSNDWATFRRNLPRLKSLHQDLNILHGKLFGKLKDPTPRGVHVELWEYVRSILEDDGIRTQSRSGSPTVVSTMLPAHSSLQLEVVNNAVSSTPLDGTDRAASSDQTMPLHTFRSTGGKLEEYEPDPDEASPLSVLVNESEPDPSKSTQKKTRGIHIRSLSVGDHPQETTHHETIAQSDRFLSHQSNRSIFSQIGYPMHPLNKRWPHAYSTPTEMQTPLALHPLASTTATQILPATPKRSQITHSQGSAHALNLNESPSIEYTPNQSLSWAPQQGENSINWQDATPALAPESTSVMSYQSNVPTTGLTAPGPIPATTPLIVRQDSDGVQWIAFGYSRDRVKMEYTIRCNIESVDTTMLLQEFKSENCIYPRACVPRDQYKGNRLHYETECNQVGWALAELNPCLRSKRGLLQRAVDSWRNANQDPRLRSRRVRRQAKIMGQKRVSDIGPPQFTGLVPAGLPDSNPLVPSLRTHNTLLSIDSRLNDHGVQFYDHPTARPC